MPCSYVHNIFEPSTSDKYYYKDEVNSIYIHSTAIYHTGLHVIITDAKLIDEHKYSFSYYVTCSTCGHVVKEEHNITHSISEIVRIPENSIPFINEKLQHYFNESRKLCEDEVKYNLYLPTLYTSTIDNVQFIQLIDHYDEWTDEREITSIGIHVSELVEDKIDRIVEKYDATTIINYINNHLFTNVD